MPNVMLRRPDVMLRRPNVMLRVGRRGLLALSVALAFVLVVGCPADHRAVLAAPGCADSNKSGSFTEICTAPTVSSDLIEQQTNLDTASPGGRPAPPAPVNPGHR
jgi:hypothetical protein